MIKDYIEYIYSGYLLDTKFDDLAAGRWLDSEVMRRLFIDAMRASFFEYGYDIEGRYEDLATAYFDEMLLKGTIRLEGDEFTGLYYRFDISQKDRYVLAVQNNSPVKKRIDSLGENALIRALKSISSEENWKIIEDGETSSLVVEPDLKEEVPAADRYVRFDDNYAARDEIINKIDEIAEAIRGDNDQDGKMHDERQRLGAELVAGKELLKAPSARIRAVWVVLGSALSFIAAQFAGGIICQMAGDLLEALRPLLGL